MLEDNIKKLIKILEESKVDELEVSTFWGKQKINIRKRSNLNDKNISIINSQDPNLSNNDDLLIEEPKEPEVAPTNNESDIDENYINAQSIKAPLVGTYYQSSNPDDPPFIKIGDKVKTGDTICIIEAMKIFNEIESEISGTVSEILVKDATPVEYDQPLIIIIPE